MNLSRPRYGCSLLALAALLALPASSSETPPAGPEQLQAELQKLIGHEFRIQRKDPVAVVSDGPDASAAQALLQLFQALPKMRALAQFPPDAPVPASVWVALFARPEDCGRYIAAHHGSLVPSFTWFTDPATTRCIVAGYVMDGTPMAARLRHAAFEAMLGAWIQAPPPWLRIGLGECMEELDWDELGKPSLGPARGHLRDYREKVAPAAPPSPATLRDLLAWDASDEKGTLLTSGIRAWAFTRFLVEEPTLRDTRVLKRLWSLLDPKADAAANAKLAQGIFLEDEWEPLARAWAAYLEKLPETPAQEPYLQARALIKDRRYEAARPLLDQALALDSQYERLYFFHAQANFYTGKFAEAREDLDRALQLFPEYHAARYLRGRTRAALNDPAGAREDLEACLETPYREQAKRELDALK